MKTKITVTVNHCYNNNITKSQLNIYKKGKKENSVVYEVKVKDIHQPNENICGRPVVKYTELSDDVTNSLLVWRIQNTLPRTKQKLKYNVT